MVKKLRIPMNIQYFAEPGEPGSAGGEGGASFDYDKLASAISSFKEKRLKKA